ncbi:hypothetical protein Apa02nite_056240 [Actinoplanes palleronii]|uniref:MFS transporter n=1 Tax=Actinoplanes palleronii TaxID=113570 RepID=A0ABQ4BFR6_9ACTN|nr:hypothetical protein Apa02nite_056240 [Actinoplanes palleronii]
MWTAHQFGGAVGAVGGGYLRDLFGGYTGVWSGSAVICLLTVLLVLTVPRRPAPPDQASGSPEPVLRSKPPAPDLGCHAGVLVLDSGSFTPPARSRAGPGRGGHCHASRASRSARIFFTCEGGSGRLTIRDSG